MPEDATSLEGLQQKPRSKENYIRKKKLGGRGKRNSWE